MVITWAVVVAVVGSVITESRRQFVASGSVLFGVLTRSDARIAHHVCLAYLRQGAACRPSTYRISVPKQFVLDYHSESE